MTKNHSFISYRMLVHAWRRCSLMGSSFKTFLNIFFETFRKLIIKQQSEGSWCAPSSLFHPQARRLVGWLVSELSFPFSFSRLFPFPSLIHDESPQWVAQPTRGSPGKYNSSIHRSERMATQSMSTMEFQLQARASCR